MRRVCSYIWIDGSQQKRQWLRIALYPGVDADGVIVLAPVNGEDGAPTGPARSGRTEVAGRMTSSARKGGVLKREGGHGSGRRRNSVFREG